MSRTYRNRRRSFTEYHDTLDPTSYIHKLSIEEKEKILSQYYKDGRREYICKCDHCLYLAYRFHSEGKAKKEIDNLVKEFYNNENIELEDDNETT